MNRDVEIGQSKSAMISRGPPAWAMAPTMRHLRLHLMGNSLRHFPARECDRRQQLGDAGEWPAPRRSPS
jgi:hypothetical protein